MSDQNMEDNEIQERLCSANRSFHAPSKLLRANYDRTKQTLELIRQTLLHTVENTRVSKSKDRYLLKINETYKSMSRQRKSYRGTRDLL